MSIYKIFGSSRTSKLFGVDKYQFLLLHSGTRLFKTIKQLVQG